MEGTDIAERQKQAILRNVESEEHRGGLKSFIGSLVIPDSKDDGEGSKKYSYFRDYQLDIKKTTEGNEFIFFLDPDADEVSYCELSTRVELKKTKMGGTEARRRNAIVTRRTFTPYEAEEAGQKLKTVEGKFQGEVSTESTEPPPKADSAGISSSDHERSSDED